MPVPIHHADAKPKILLACSNNQFLPWSHNPFVGRLLTPPLCDATDCHRYTAMDNFAFTDWRPERFVLMLRRHERWAGSVRWVACPDVVGDWRKTRLRFEAWAEVVRSFGYKCGYVLQDGQSSDDVPWREIRAVFLGGTTEFKLSPEAHRLCLDAKDQGKLVHVGRVNSITRMSRFLSVADSFDGLSYSKFSRAKLRPVLDWLRNQMVLRRGLDQL